MSILFINGSPNKKGNTARLAAALLGSRDYETLNLTDLSHQRLWPAPCRRSI